MPTIADVRAKFPQYEDMSDSALADALHAKFYSDMPRDQFNAKIGFDPTADLRATSAQIADAARNAPDPTEAIASARSIRKRADVAERAAGNTAFADASGAGIASAVPFSDEITSALLSPVNAAIDAAKGRGFDVGRAYTENQAVNAELARRRQERSPVASTVGQIAGALGAGGAAANGNLTLMRGAPSLPSLIGRGAVEGAAYGGLYSAGDGNGLADRAYKGGAGALAGGILGGAIPAVAATAKSAIKPFTDAVGARVNPAVFADQKIAERLAASNMTPDTVAARMQAAPGLNAADVAGKSTRDLLRTAVNIPGPAKDAVAKAVTLRQFGQGDRLKAALADTFANPDGYLAAKDNLAQAAKTVSKPLYDRFYKTPVHFSETLEDILNTPAGKSALSHAQTLAGNEQQPFKQVFVNIRGQAHRVPDARGWDYIKRSMDDMIGAQTDNITGKVTNEGRILTNLKNRMVTEIDRVNPYYKPARQAYGGIAQIDEAMEFGRKSFSMSNDAVRREIGAMTPQQKEAARIGAADALRNEIDRAGWTHNSVIKVIGTRQKFRNLRTLFDNDRQFADFRRSVFAEARKRSTYEAVKGQSTTAAQLADMMEAGGTSEAADFIGNAVTSGPVNATLRWIGSRLKMLGGFTPEVAANVAKRLTTSNPQNVRQIVAELNRIQSAKLSAQQRSQAIQAMISRASAPMIANAQAR